MKHRAIVSFHAIERYLGIYRKIDIVALVNGDRLETALIYHSYCIIHNIFRPPPNKMRLTWGQGEEMIEALYQRTRFRLAASGNDDPALAARLEKPGRAYGSTIDSKQLFPVCAS